MQTLVLFPLFLVVTLAFGYLFSFVVLKERRIFAVVPFAIVIGVNAYNFFVNLASYAFPFSTTPQLVLAAFAIADVALWAIARRKNIPLMPERGSITQRQTRILFIIAIAISLLAGAFALRSLGFDDLAIGHLSLVSTILEGNFPVRDPATPDHLLEYHYGSDLLTAALARAAAIPPWLGYDIQIILFSGAALLMGFVLAFELSGRWRASLLAALLMLLGAGLTWLRFTEGIEPLWQKFVLHQEVFAPWKFLATMSAPRINGSILARIFNHNAAVGFPVMIFVFILYFRALALTGRSWIPYTLTAAVAFGYLALNLETNFVILLAAMGIALLAAFIAGRDLLAGSASPRRIAAVTLIIAAIGVPLALYQGGIFSALLAGGGHSSFTPATHILTLDFTAAPGSPLAPVRLFSRTMLEEFGLLLALFIPAFIAYRRNARVLFLALIAIAAFLVPFAILYETRPPDIKRLFGISTPLMYFVAGLYLDGVLERASSRKWLTRFVWLLVLLGISWSLYFLAVYITTPYGYIGQLNRPLIDTPPEPAAIDARAYAWIRVNTTIRDRFFPFSHDFIRDTGRFTPGYFNPGFHYPDEVAAYDRFVASCDAGALAWLNVSHLYVSPIFPLGEHSESCLRRLHAIMVYREENNDDFRRIYRLPQPLGMPQ
ncbi:MAG: hypothetical protein Q8R35_03535 [bacterium]|nr:hypothetical protein [bacterium]